jgi:hypothetical protein
MMTVVETGCSLNLAKIHVRLKRDLSCKSAQIAKGIRAASHKAMITAPDHIAPYLLTVSFTAKFNVKHPTDHHKR